MIYILNNRPIGAIIKYLVEKRLGTSLLGDVVLQMLSGIRLYQGIDRVMSLSQFFKIYDINIPLDFPI